MIEYRKWITRSMLRKEPEKLFVFGDNLVRRGMGGQAKHMRGEPNAVGIMTKIHPHMRTDAFLVDRNYDDWYLFTKNDFTRLKTHVLQGGVVVWPLDGIGSGRAQLKQRAPLIWNAIKRFQATLDR